MQNTEAEASRFLEGLTAPPTAVANVVDNRVKVTDTAMFPWAAIGQVLATFPSGVLTVSSGALVRSKYIVTAGHALFRAALGGQATSVTFAPGRSGDTLPYGSFDVAQANMRIAPGFVPGSPTDYGMLILDVDLEMIVGGSFALTNLSAAQLNALGDFSITGYPIDKGGDEMWTAEGTLSAFTANYLFTETAFATAGQSGGPAWTFFDAAGEFGLFGIFIASNPDGMTCVRVNTAVAQQYQTWMS